MISEVEYLGHSISAKGIQPISEKVRAIRDAPRPQDVSQLRSFLGMLNYYGKFIPNLATLLRPLYDLLQSAKTWSWGKSQEQAFCKAKELLSSAPLLTHYDPEKPLVLSCDASPYGVGAVLSHCMEDQSEQPITYVSRTLSPAELKYAQLDKEALSIVFGVKHFHQYLYGRKFAILSDHKPLQYLLGETRGIPAMASAHIQRWALMLSAYNYATSLEQIMPTLMVSVDYLCPTTSQLYLYQETCSCCSRHCKVRRSKLIRFDSGLTRIPFYLVCAKMFSVVGLTQTNLSYNRISREQPSSVFRMGAYSGVAV